MRNHFISFTQLHKLVKGQETGTWPLSKNRRTSKSQRRAELQVHLDKARHRVRLCRDENRRQSGNLWSFHYQRTMRKLKTTIAKQNYLIMSEVIFLTNPPIHMVGMSCQATMVSSSPHGPKGSLNLQHLLLLIMWP